MKYLTTTAALLVMIGFPLSASAQLVGDIDNSTLLGGAIGAGIGGVIGSNVAGTNVQQEGTAIGATLGGLAGAAYGSRHSTNPHYPYAGQYNPGVNKNNLLGTAIGAGIGGVIGSNVAGTNVQQEGTAIGAVVGGLAGYALSNKKKKMRYATAPSYSGGYYTQGQYPQYSQQGYYTYGQSPQHYGSYTGQAPSTVYTQPTYQTVSPGYVQGYTTQTAPTFVSVPSVNYNGSYVGSQTYPATTTGVTTGTAYTQTYPSYNSASTYHTSTAPTYSGGSGYGQPITHVVTSQPTQVQTYTTQMSVPHSLCQKPHMHSASTVHQTSQPASYCYPGSTKRYDKNGRLICTR